jgi:hypothetical protein
MIVELFCRAFACHIFVRSFVPQKPADCNRVGNMRTPFCIGSVDFDGGFNRAFESDCKFFGTCDDVDMIDACGRGIIFLEISIERKVRTSSCSPSCRSLLSAAWNNKEETP